MVEGVELRRRREALGLTQGDASRLSGISQQYISRIEHGILKGGDEKAKYEAFLAAHENPK